MSDVRMRHPNLPDEQTITVAERAVPHHRAAGWVVVDDPAPKPQAEPEPASEPAPDAAETTEPPARRRRRTTEGE